MPHDNLNCYYVPGGYGQHTITRMSQMVYSCLANSTAMYAHPYATADSLIQRVNSQGEDWYHDEANDLHLRDFIWFAQMQTAWRMRDQGTQIRNIDRVLDRLLVEGILSGNWTCRTYVFSLNFYFLMFLHNFLLCFPY